ncbi:MAG: exodeoxyribonuclease VII small subunit [Bacteroidia bacterium]
MAKKKNEPAFEDKLQRIKAIADKLQREELSLDDSMALFKEADQLIQESRSFLQQASLKVEELINQSTGETRPFH